MAAAPAQQDPDLSFLLPSQRAVAASMLQRQKFFVVPVDATNMAALYATTPGHPAYVSEDLLLDALATLLERHLWAMEYAQHAAMKEFAERLLAQAKGKDLAPVRAIALAGVTAVSGKADVYQCLEGIPELIVRQVDETYVESTDHAVCTRRARELYMRAGINAENSGGACCLPELQQLFRSDSRLRELHGQLMHGQTEMVGPAASLSILDPERAQVLIDSPDAAERHGSGNLAAWFVAGHGVILDSVSHFDLQGLEVAQGLKTEKERQIYAIEHMGLTYAQWRTTKHEAY